MKKKTTVNGFGRRLAYYRKAKGLTQQALGESVGVSNRVIAYYEGETDYPPAHLIVPLATALGITTDELLGIAKTKSNFDPQNAALWRRLKIVEELPRKDQKAILHYITMVANNRGINQKTG
jgi:transcriptional regulator with XRE-family HTH domain